MVLKRLTLCTGSQNNVSVHVPLVLQYRMDYSTSDYLLANPLALKSHSKNTHTEDESEGSILPSPVTAGLLEL